MFGNRREIESLRAIVGHYESLKHLELAEALQDKVDQQIAAGASTDAVDEVLASIQAETMAKVLEQRLSSMPAAEFFGLCREVTGEAMAVDALARIAAVRNRAVERQATLDEITEEARVYRRLDLTRLPVGQIVEVGFFDSSLPIEKRHTSLKASRRILGRVDNPDRPNELTVLMDKAKDRDGRPYWMTSHNQLADFNIFKFGTLVGEGEFSPTVTLDAAVAVERPDPTNNYSKRQITKMFQTEFGYLVTIDGQQLLGRLDANGLTGLVKEHATQAT